MTDKAQDEAGLTPFKDDNAVRRKTGVQDVLVLWWYDYICPKAPPESFRAVLFISLKTSNFAPYYSFSVTILSNQGHRLNRWYA